MSGLEWLNTSASQLMLHIYHVVVQLTVGVITFESFIG